MRALSARTASSSSTSSTTPAPVWSAASLLRCASLAAASAAISSSLGNVAGQEDAEGRAAGPATDSTEDVAAGLLDDAVDHRQAKPGALADLLGGEERLEDLLKMLVRDAGAGVLDLQQRRNRSTGRLSYAEARAHLATRSRCGCAPESRRRILGMASRALTARLTTTCSSWPRSALTGQRSRPWRTSSVILSATTRFSISERSDSDVAKLQHLRAQRLAAREREQLPDQRWRRGMRSA